jgi:hypothetical protein
VKNNKEVVQMKITILNGNPEPQNTVYEDYLTALCQRLDAQDHRVEMLTLRDMDIKHCLGCWDCWLKTPGRCVVKDDSETVCRSVINADVVLFASPIIMGTTSALLKRAQDKLIPLILPYIEIDHGECHHVKRYEKYPTLGLLLQRNDADDEDVEITTELFRRLAINFKSRLAFSKTMDHAVEEVADEINHI